MIAKALPALEDFVNPETSSSFGPSEILLRIKAALIGFWTELAQEMVVRFTIYINRETKELIIILIF